VTRAESDELGVALASPRSVRELLRQWGGALDEGIEDARVRRVVSPEHAGRDDDLVVVTSLRWTRQATESRGVILCSSEVADRCPRGRRWIHDQPMWVVAQLLSDIPSEPPEGISGSAWVDPRASVHPTAAVRRGAVIRAGAHIGAHADIGEGAVIFGRTRLAERVVVGPLSVVGRPGFGWTIGPGGEPVRIPQLGGVIVEADVEIGPLCTIDAGTLSPTILRRGVKLDAHVHVAHNVSLGEGTMVAAQAGFAGSARVGAGVLVGGQAGVKDHARVGRGARIGAKSGVIGDVPDGAAVAGFPAVPRIRWLRAWAKLLGSGNRSNE